MSGPISAQQAIGVDGFELMRLVHEDLERHEAALNEHQRTSLTIRGLALTAIAGLVAGSYAAWVAVLDIFAIAATFIFLGADYYYSRLYTGVERRLPVLESLSITYRRLLSRPVRSRNAIDDFRGDLRSYAKGAVAADTRPRLWPIGSLGRLKVFLPLYGALVVFAGVSAWFIGSREKPGTSRDLPAIVCVDRQAHLTSRPQPIPRAAVVPCEDVAGLFLTGLTP